MKKLLYLALSGTVLLAMACSSGVKKTETAESTVEEATTEEVAEEAATAETAEATYFLNYNEETYKATRVNFSGDGIKGDAQFEIDGCKLIIDECWKSVSADGMESLAGNTYSARYTMGDATLEGEATIAEVKIDKENDMGAYWGIKGTFTDTEGNSRQFYVSAFNM